MSTTTAAVPTGAISAAEMPAVSCVVLTNVVVRLAPFQRTVEPLTNPVPFTVSVKPDPPAFVEDGDNVVTRGAGLLDCVPPLVCSRQTPASQLDETR